MADEYLSRTILDAMAARGPEDRAEVDYTCAEIVAGLTWEGNLWFKPDLTGYIACRPENVFGRDGQLGERDEDQWVKVAFTFEDILEELRGHDADAIPAIRKMITMLSDLEKEIVEAPHDQV